MKKYLNRIIFAVILTNFSAALYADTQLESTIMRDYRYSQSIINSLPKQAFGDYVKQLDDNQKIKLKEKMKEIKLAADQISIELNDWFNRQDRDFQRKQLLKH